MGTDILLTDYHQALELWGQTALGRVVWDAVCKEVENLTNDFFGRRMLLVGTFNINAWLNKCPITERIFVADQHVDLGESLCADTLYIPLPDNCMDAIILPFALEWLPNVEAAMQELSRVLIPQGNLLIIGFNPVSLWGLKYPWHKSSLPPFRGHMRRIGYVRHLLDEADCILDDIRTCYYGFPVLTPNAKTVKTLETLGRLGWPSWGSVYLIHAHKEVLPLTPIRPKWMHKTKWVDEPGLIRDCRQ